MKRFLFCLIILLMASQAQAEKSILVWGDSLSAGHRLRTAPAWPNLLALKLASEGYRYEVANASIPGETTEGGKTRLPEALRRLRPVILILELGTNDGKGLQPIPVMKSNLAEMIQAAQSEQVQVLILGMRLPFKPQSTYTQAFQNAFGELAATYKTGLVPFFLETVFQHPDLLQDDGLHPTAEAQALILEAVWTGLKPLLRK